MTEEKPARRLLRTLQTRQSHGSHPFHSHWKELTLNLFCYLINICLALYSQESSVKETVVYPQSLEATHPQDSPHSTAGRSWLLLVHMCILYTVSFTYQCSNNEDFKKKNELLPLPNKMLSTLLANSFHQPDWQAGRISSFQIKKTNTQRLAWG